MGGKTPKMEELAQTFIENAMLARVRAAALQRAPLRFAMNVSANAWLVEFPTSIFIECLS